MKFRGLAVVAILLCVQTALFAQRDRISSSIDRSRIAVLSGNIHAKAQAQYDQGPADPFLAIENVTLRLKSSPEQQGLLDRFRVADIGKSTCRPSSSARLPCMPTAMGHRGGRSGCRGSS